jgi:uncharacterized membrane protein
VRIGYLKCGLVSILLITLVFSLVIITSPVSAGGVTSHPGGTTIEVVSGQTFLLRHELYFDKSAGGYFAFAINWDAPSSDENFTLENAPSVYWISGPENGLPVENVQWENIPTLTGWGVAVLIDASDMNYVDGHFNVDIWLRACGGDGTPHRPMDSHQISYGSGILVIEGTPSMTSVPPVTIRVLGRGVDVTISPDNQSGVPGTTLNYTVTVKNTGNMGSDNYNLTVSDNAGWALTLDNYRSENVPENVSRTTTLHVHIPDNATGNTNDNVIVKATSRGDNTKSDNASCIAQAIASIRRGVQVSISPSTQDNENGGTLRYTVTIKNTGNVTEDYDLDKTDTRSWTLTLPSSVTDVIPDENRQVTLTVGIPATAENNTSDTITVTATSSENTEIENSATCVARCIKGAVITGRGVRVTIDSASKSGAPGEVINFTVTVTNTGTSTDTFTLTASDTKGWAPTFASPTEFSLGARESKSIEMHITIPSTAADGDSTTITVTAAGTGYDNSASCTAKAAAGTSPLIYVGVAVVIVVIVASILVISKRR